MRARGKWIFTFHYQTTEKEVTLKKQVEQKSLRCAGFNEEPICIPMPFGVAMETASMVKQFDLMVE